MKNSERSEARKNEILDIAQRLFLEVGYEKTTISAILDESGIAKGSLYYYYRSKEEVLDGVIRRITEGVAAAVRAVADDPALTAHEKMSRLFAAMDVSDMYTERLTEELHKPSNALLHQKSITWTSRAIAPIVAGVVAQGIREGVYRTQYPLETTELLLVLGQLIFDEGIFEWPQAEKMARVIAFIDLAETALGAEKGSFRFLVQNIMRPI